MSYNKSLFQGVPKKQVNKSRFNLSHEWKAQIRPGFLYPCMVIETLPQDEFDLLDTEFMFRFNPLYFPIMHKITMRCDYFYIPNRILWPGDGPNSDNGGWKAWIAEQNETTHPWMQANMVHTPGTTPLNVMAYMGLPLIKTGVVGTSTTISDINAFPLSAYLKIWDEYYRNPQLETEKWFPLDDGNNSAAFQDALNPGGTANVFLLLYAKWEKDYFTSALPSPQINDAIRMPLVENYTENGINDLPTSWYNLASGTIGGDGSLGQTSGISQIDASENVGLDIQETAGTIRELRLAEVLQSYYERIMKVGQRYRDFIEGLWGNDPEPGVIDIPQMIGSRFGRVQIADVMTQAFTEVGETGMVRTGDYTGQANMYSNDGGTYKWFCQEHGFLMAILQVNPNTSYGQGIERFWRRSLSTDYPLDMFSSIGDQEIYKEEVLYNPYTAQEDKNAETFGYIPRFSEMRYKNNVHIGNLNDSFGLSQHLGRVWNTETVNGATYDTTIEINDVFVSSAPVLLGGIRESDVFRAIPNGVGSLTSEGTIYAHLFHTVYVNRALPMYSTPDLT